MSSLTTDQTLRDALKRARGLAEVRNGKGAVLGYVLPPMSRKKLQLYLTVLAEYDPAETERRARTGRGKGRTTREVLARLKRS
jgi:hypothetical protein